MATRPSAGPQKTKKLFNDIIDDLEDLEAEDTAINAEITKLKAKSLHTFIVEENGELFFYSIPAVFIGPVDPPA